MCNFQANVLRVSVVFFVLTVAVVSMLFLCCFYAASMLFICCFYAVSMLFICCFYAVSMLFICCFYAVSILFICCFDFVEIYNEKLVFQKFSRKPTNFFNYIDFIQKLNLVDLQTQGGWPPSSRASSESPTRRQAIARSSPSVWRGGNPSSTKVSKIWRGSDSQARQ